MQDNWLAQRPHLKGLVTKMQSRLEFADEMWRRGRASGDGVEYERFEEHVAQRSADIECAVHEVALSSLMSMPLSFASGARPTVACIAYNANAARLRATCR